MERRDFELPDPDWMRDLSHCPLSDRDKELLEKFWTELENDRMEHCARCQETWFDMGLKGGICKRCIARDKNKKEDEPWFFSAENQLDFGLIPAFLPQLTIVEEMLIARVHVFVNVMQVRGQQYKYRGHIVHFLRDVGKVYSQLPLLPPELDVILLRPPTASEHAHLNRQFRRQFRVRRRCLQEWLNFLSNNHPGYRGITVCQKRMSVLPEDGDVLDQVATAAVTDPLSANLGNIENDDVEPDEVDQSAVPDLLPEDTEMEALRSHVLGEERGEHLPVRPSTQHQLEMPDIRRTPINEFNHSQALLSLAFPTLFPRGQADFVEPRLRPIKYADYIQHALRWHDGRFARHPTFRFVVFNTLMRAQARAKSSYFVKEYQQRQGLITRDDLLEAFQNPESAEAQQLLNSINRQTAQLRGTRPYWYRKRRELESYAYNLDCPGAFITFSPADLHWRSLYQHLPQFQDWQELPEQQRMGMSSKLLRDNPHIAAWHFYRRFGLFRDIVLKQKFNVTDYWNRYEWQGRGSSHCHGLFWMDGAPSVDLENEHLRKEFARIWRFHVTAFNPEPARVRQQGEGNPLAVNPLQHPLTFQWLSQVLNRCQRHHCSETYCLRKKKGSEEISCRFFFPRDTRDTADVVRRQGQSYFSFEAARNDSLMNHYNRCLSLGWLANIDISPCTSLQAVINYAAKYCSKMEKRTDSYASMGRQILPYVSHQNPLLSFASRLMNKLLTERDFSGQEICHVLLNCELQEGTRVIRAVDCRPYEQQGRSLRLQGDHDDAEVVGIYEKYLSRPPLHEELTYLDFLANWNTSKRDGRKWTRWSRQAKPRVLYYFPRYKSNHQHHQYDDFCRVKLMLAHPHRDPNELRKINGVEYNSYASAAEFCYGNHRHPDDYYGTPNAEERRPDPDEFEEEFHEPDLLEEDWLELARQLPDCPPSQEAIDLLGRRDIDIQYDWTPHVGRYADPGIVQGDYWRQRIEQNRLYMDVEDMPLEVRDALNPEQRIVYDTFIGHFQCGSEEQILLHVDGGGGTGKSYMIKVLSSHLQRLAGNRPSPIWRAAPTGVASNQIMGTTLHSLLRLPMDRAFTELSPADANAIQKKLRDVRYLVIDEKSMLGLRQLSWIDKRLRQVFPARAAEFFGGISIILVGDFFQLPPIANKPLYFDGPLKDLHEVSGQTAYRAFNHTVFLKKVQRQQGDDQAGFRLALEELRGLKLSIESWKLLSQRVQVKLSQREEDTFDAALRIYSKKARVNEYNYEHLVRLKHPAIQVMAKNIGNGADKATSEQAGNLAGQFPVCIGARLMLTQNIWQPAGLVNGAQGTVYDIGWAPGADAHRDPPSVIMMVMDKYTGPSYLTTDDGREVVPILPVKRDFFLGTSACTRKQFPLMASYAITVHKSQSITVDKMVTDLSERDFQTGLSYVAVSRVKMLDGLMIDAPFERASLHYEKLPDGKHSSIMLFTLEALQESLIDKMAANNEGPIVAPDEDVQDDRDSSIGYDATSSTASLSSSILDFRHENGRTYHAYKDGKSILLGTPIATSTRAGTPITSRPGPSIASQEGVRLGTPIESPVSSPSIWPRPARERHSRPPVQLQQSAIERPVMERRDFELPDPDWMRDLSHCPLSDRDKELLEKFWTELENDRMEHCARCQETWFDMGLKGGICKRCIARDKNKKEDEPWFFSAENQLDFGLIPAFLPQLTIVEEMLIARVHVFVNVMQVRGQQYKYRGHIVHFLRDVGKVYSQLPLLPPELDVILLRPPTASEHAHLNRQFRRQFRVRRRCLQEWLNFLSNNHPGYRGITVCQKRMSVLPEDGDVLDQVATAAVTDPLSANLGNIENDDVEPDEVDQSAVPDLLPEDTEMEALRSHVLGEERGEHLPVRPSTQHQLEMPDIRRTPINEFNHSQALLSLAFPTLFPRGQADFVEPRLRPIKYADYIQHALRWHDGRFARHPTFRFVVFNTLMRAQARAKSSYFVKEYQQRQGLITRDDLLEAFQNPESAEAQQLLNSINRQTAQLRGTRPYWYRKRRELESYAYNLDCPGAFITFSPADLHWRSLYQHLPQFQDWQELPEQQRMGMSSKLLRDNPHIAAWHFYRRFGLFRDIVLKQKFNVTDYWNRYEWQGRGSSHCHGLFWMDGAPSVDLENEHLRKEFARIWRFHVTAFNPEPARVRQQGEAKYCSKMEKRTDSYASLGRQILPNVSHQNPLLSFASRLMNKLLTERDFSGQEICHVLLNCELQEGTRVIRAVDCRPYEQQGRSLRLQGDHDDAEVVGIYEKYLSRPPLHEELTYLDFLANWNTSNRDGRKWTRWSRQAKPRVLYYFPRYKSNPQHHQYDGFCRVKLMLAHPHRDPNELRKINGVEYNSYASAAEFCYGNHRHPDDYYGTPNAEERRPDPDEFEEEFHEPDLLEEDWLELARQLPDCPPSQEAIDLLGRRDIDIQYDWTPHVGRYADPGIVQGDYWRQRIEQNRLYMDVEDMSLEVRDTLNSEQRIVYDTFIGHFQCGSEEQILLHVDGGGGTGKSYMVKVLSSHLQRLAGNRPSPIWRAAPTGVASNQIMGTTLHSLLRLPVDRAFTELSPADANAVQNKLRDVRYLVIDEKSMLGLRQLSWIDKRLRQVFPARAAEFFGGISIILVGDFFQLPPIANKPLYFDGPLKDLHEVSGQTAYRAFNHTVFLKKVQRQQGDDQAGFRLALEELRGLKLSIESWKLLSQRVQVKLSQREEDTFDAALRIYSKKARVNEYNYEHLVRLKHPAIQVMAKNIGNGADKATSEQAGNLAGQFPVCIGARLMLTQNIWQPAGLVNGAQGTVYDIGWAPGADAHRDPPSVIMMVMDKYTGPSYLTTDDGREVVPILPVKRDFFLGTSACTRKQFPLMASYAITVHKSQSITVDKMVTDLSERDFQTGLSYVAVSRVKMLDGLMIDAPFERASLHYEKLPDGKHSSIMLFTLEALNLAPGGYVEIQEIDVMMKADDGTLGDDSAIMKWSNLLNEASVKLQQAYKKIDEFKDMMAEAGFTEIVDMRFKWPTNHWPKDKKYKELGVWNNENIAIALESLTIAPFTRAHG
ncbi:hypothetical protein FOFC_19576 [Fusarium oxysporum]|nr:hypothetical protein FOFC_19576 [Fusarium oxysporum]